MQSVSAAAAAAVAVELPPHSDNVDEELSRIRFALDTVYSTSSSTTTQLQEQQQQEQQQQGGVSGEDEWLLRQRHFANQYLTRFQSTAISWIVCDRLLWETTTTTTTTTTSAAANASSSGGFVPANQLLKLQQRQFFAAQTLHTKCRFDRDVQQLLSSSPQDPQIIQQQQQPSELEQQQQQQLRNSPVLISLRDSLLQHLNRSVMEGTGNVALTTRLAMCISALAVQMGWTTILHDLLLTMQANNNNNNNNSSSNEQQQAAQTILFILRALPEECASDRLILIHDEFRFLMRDHLIDASATVFSFLLHHLSHASAGAANTSSSSSNNNNMTIRVLQGWHAWIRYVPVRPHVIAESPLLPATVQALVLAGTAAVAEAKGETTTATTTESLSPDIVEQATDVVVEILRMYPSHGPPDNQILMQQMLQLLSRLPLQQVLSSSSSSPGNQNDEDEEDSGLIRDYCRIVTEMGESYLSWILSAAASSSHEEQDMALLLVDWILLCSSLIRNRQVSAMTLTFWYRLVQDLEDTEPMEWRQELIDHYLSNRLLQLIHVCVLNLMKFPADIIHPDFPQDLVEEINRHRYHVSETVEDICRLLGGHVVLQCIAELLQRQIITAGDKNNININNHWQGLESCLACLVAIHKFVPNDEAHVLPFVFERLVPELTSYTSGTTTTPIPPPLRFTVCKVIGKFARWLADRTTRCSTSNDSNTTTNVIVPLMPFLAQSLSVKECAPAAAVSIKELCIEANPHSFPIAQPVLELYEQVAAVNVAATAAAAAQQIGRLGTTTTTMELGDELELLEGVCAALSKHIHLISSGGGGGGGGSEFLQRLVQPIGTRLTTNSTLSTATPRTILPDIQRLAIIVQHLKVYVDLQSAGHGQPQHPIVNLMQSLWPILETLIARFPNDTNTAEQICRLHKHSMRSCGAVAYSPMLGQLMHHLVEGYRRSHQAPFLYAASICVSQYGAAAASNNNNTRDGLYAMIAALSSITFSFLTSTSLTNNNGSSGSVEDLTNNPDVVEELFYLMDRVLTHCSGALLVSLSPPTEAASNNNVMLLPALVQAAIICMKLDHDRAHKGTIQFLDALVARALEEQQQQRQQQQQSSSLVEQVLSQYGGGIVHNLVGALAGDLPSYSHKIPDVLWKLSRIFNNSNNNNNGVFAQWLSTSLAHIPSASLLHEGMKTQFLTSATTPGVTREEFFLAVRAFQNACHRQNYRRQQQQQPPATATTMGE